MTNIQHPYEPSNLIPLDQLLDLIGHELELIELEDMSPRSGTALLNDVLARVANPVEKQMLFHAINDRFVGE